MPTLPSDFTPILATSLLASASFSWQPAEDVPAPFRQLLVHDRDMTSALERFHGDSITLEIHHSRRDGGLYLREVTLHAATTGKPVEYGLIEIFLDAFPADLHPRILAGDTPLGAILNAAGFEYRSSPQGFFTVPAEALIKVFPGSSGGKTLHGRYNHLIRDDGVRLARIIEILPPAP